MDSDGACGARIGSTLLCRTCNSVIGVGTGGLSGHVPPFMKRQKEPFLSMKSALIKEKINAVL